MRWKGLPIDEYSEDRKEIRPALDFVDDDQTAQRRQRGHRFGQALEIQRVLEVEVVW